MDQNTRIIDVANNFMVVYVGEDKVITKASKTDVLFYAQRAVQELSYDTLKSSGSIEITLPASLQMALPDDYVNYTKISCVDSAGIKHPLYPTSKTSYPNRYQQDSEGDFIRPLIPAGEMIKNGNFAHGYEGWKINEHGSSSVYYTPTTAAGTLSDPLTDQVGWFYSSNSIIGYNVPTQQTTLKQALIFPNTKKVISGEKYTVTYTLSGHSSGSINFVVIDENGHYTSGAVRAANGTFTETITAGTNIPSILYPLNTIYFQSFDAIALNATIDSVSVVRVGFEEGSITWDNYNSATPSENQDDYQDDTYWPMEGSRFGLDPQHAQANGSFFIDHEKIYFSSNISGKTVILDYMTDGLEGGVGAPIHKFAEEAVYKSIIYGLISTRANVPEGVVRRYKKEKSVAIRNAKLRLSNIKLEEITQVLRGKSKQIKH